MSIVDVTNLLSVYLMVGGKKISIAPYGSRLSIQINDNTPIKEVEQEVYDWLDRNVCDGSVTGCDIMYMQDHK